MTSYMNEKRYRRIEEIEMQLQENESLTFAEVDALEAEKRSLLETCRQANRMAQAGRCL